MKTALKLVPLIIFLLIYLYYISSFYVRQDHQKKEDMRRIDELAADVNKKVELVGELVDLNRKCSNLDTRTYIKLGCDKQREEILKQWRELEEKP